MATNKEILQEIDNWINANIKFKYQGPIKATIKSSENKNK